MSLNHGLLLRTSLQFRFLYRFESNKTSEIKESESVLKESYVHAHASLFISGHFSLLVVELIKDTRQKLPV